MRTLKMDGMEKIMMGLTDLKLVRQLRREVWFMESEAEIFLKTIILETARRPGNTGVNHESKTDLR